MHKPGYPPVIILHFVYHDLFTGFNVNLSKRLYYYCKLSTAIEKILPNKQLLLNQLGKTNDPREYKSFIFARKKMSIKDLIDNHSSNEHIKEVIQNVLKQFPGLFDPELINGNKTQGTLKTSVCCQLFAN